MLKYNPDLIGIEFGKSEYGKFFNERGPERCFTSVFIIVPIKNSLENSL